jgi:hypothetical protein
MIRGREGLNFKYYSKFLNKDFELTEWEKRVVERYFRNELNILSEQEIDFTSKEILLLVDMIRFHNFLSY